ncbi:putative beta-glucosidase [Bifidobacterium actinocoloniiforme DSM 22766]|uniref:Exo-alpha-(1->6)-L-arabinopyranosidase n=1 Tax=Bifidobacterium actinocoloniiforme DSM 22766 TaxID=1437605 RepID=A0A086YYS8_9BIFI|nr:exo-alpha-(1->6)-L-arabinopyranosidase [Bifidobacterium actinocoloniiforme]AKV55949.1 beta-glucosidase [Bifidobacterium actinocoloniiforme DSM 22766]KFI39428.1 putative beta-glucosidase [Bifidobacterium actinocoloniiforme DSM 22766]
MSEPTHVNSSDLSLEEEASLTSGSDSWHVQGLPDRGLEGYMITDGPYGLRKAKDSSSTDVYGSVPATCFPPTAGLASSWNPELTYKVGQAMGEECVQEKVAVILGPGVNIKRSPLGGRDFEYWSEDPVLTGHQAAELVEGVQSQGIGTSVKHFAANNQETERLRASSDMDERTLREIYLPAFEYIVKKAKPWTLMCAYNRLNGVFGSEDGRLMTDILRGEWGFDGIVMSDWGAVHNRAAALNAGLNLEMPPSDSDDQVVAAVKAGELSKEQLDKMAQGMIDLIEKAKPAMSRDGYRYDVQAHNQVARQAACESVVMLKNEDGILPLRSNEKIAVIGEFARTPRYQGGGSSHISPTMVTTALEAFENSSMEVSFAPGFTLDEEPQDEALTNEALQAASKADKVVLFLGLPEEAESEGFDRTSLDMPAKQVGLLGKVSAVNPNVVVVLSNGSVVSLTDWLPQAKGVLEAWLLGQAGGQAVVDLLTGRANPSGKLAQTIPLRLNDDPTVLNFPGEEGHVNYGEGVFVGYRYYDTLDKPVLFPFGFGLSYSDFEVSGVQVEKTGANAARVHATVTNTSQVDGAETLQVYVAPGKAKVNRPAHELKAFSKVFLKAGESKAVSMDLDERDFAYWSRIMKDWHIEAGDYGIELATSSRDIVQTVTIHIDGDGKTFRLNEESSMQEWEEDPIGSPILSAKLKELEADGVHLPDDPNTMVLFRTMPMGTVVTFSGANGRQVIKDLMASYKAALAK